MVVSRQRWVLGTEFVSSGKASSFLTAEPSLQPPLVEAEPAPISLGLISYPQFHMKPFSMGGTVPS